MDANRTVRIAFESPAEGVTELPLWELAQRMVDDRSGKYLHAEYVELDSPYATHAEIRRYGYSCRVFEPFKLRR